MKEMINKLISIRLEQLTGDSKQEMIAADEVYLNDKRDEIELEKRYMELDLPRKQRMLINDYIACTATVHDRYADISYMAGIKDTVRVIDELGLLKEIKVVE